MLGALVGQGFEEEGLIVCWMKEGSVNADTGEMIRLIRHPKMKSFETLAVSFMPDELGKLY